MVGNRRKAREIALQLLFQDEFHTLRSRRVAEYHFWESLKEAQKAQGEDSTPNAADNSEVSAALKSEVRLFAAFLVTGVREHQEEVDNRIRHVARNWKIERMSRVDRNILRISTFELLFALDIPPKVSLNEAIEIAKIYGAEDSGAFINGILDRISRDVVRARKAAGAAEEGAETAETVETVETAETQA